MLEKVAAAEPEGLSTEAATVTRRQWVVWALTMGLLASGGALPPRNGEAALFGRVPRQLPKDQSVYDLSGDAEVNGRRITPETRIAEGDLVETGSNGRIVFVVGQDSFSLREGSRLQLAGGSGIVSALRIITGSLLSVFGRSRHRISTSVATIGIRGTGVYVEAEEERSYICTCYGVTKLTSNEDRESWAVIRSLGHDMPRYVYADAAAGEAIQGAPLKNHTDIELKTLEALVGRDVPFGFSFERYRVRPREY